MNMISHNLHESLSLFLWIFKFLMWLFLQFNEWKRLLFIPSVRGRKHTFKLFENTLMLCFQACVFSLVAQEQFLNFGIVHCYLEWQASSHLWIWTRSLIVFYFFSTSLLPAGNRTTNFDGISFGNCVKISSSASQELFFLVKTCWPC